MSDVVSLHCPKCGQKLKIKDRSLFGRKVKCPECKKSFVLVDPDGPEFPSGEVPTTPQQQKPSVAPPSLKQTVRFPAFESPTDLIPDANPLDFTKAASVSPLPPFPPPPPAPAGPMTPDENPFAALEADSFGSYEFPPPYQPRKSTSGAASTIAPPETLQTGPLGSIATDSPLIPRRRSLRSGNWIGMFAGMTVGCLLIVAIGYNLAKQPVPSPIASSKVEDINPVVTAPVVNDGSYSKVALEDDPKLVAEFSPTKGDPIQLLMMPSGVNIVVHLRPSLFWSDEYIYRVLRASLTDDVTHWLAQQIKTYCRRAPEQIEEVTFGIILGGRGMDPRVCTVVRLKEPERMSALIAEFPGNYLHDIAEKPNVRIKVDEKHGVLIVDEKTFAICPAELANELEFWINTPNYEVSDGIAGQLKQTDRQRLFTTIATTNDLNIHLKQLFPEAAQPMMSALLEWLGTDVDTIGWSVHPEPYLHSQIFLTPITTKSPVKLKEEFTARLAKAPERVWKDLCEKMSPTEMRFRKLIGRLPAMLQAFQESTVAQLKNRDITLTTVLPSKATPNLALATLFTVNEAARTNFGASRPTVAAADKPKLPPTIAGRIELPVDAEFNRTPLEPALQFLCDEIQVKLFVDGDALKDAGYTKNMPQTFTLGKVPMKEALSKIIETYQERDKEMVACFDDSKMLITVTTRKFAERDGLKISLPVSK